MIKTFAARGSANRFEIGWVRDFQCSFLMIPASIRTFAPAQLILHIMIYLDVHHWLQISLGVTMLSSSLLFVPFAFWRSRLKVRGYLI